MAENPEQTGSRPEISLAIETFAAHHPNLNPALLIEAAVEALVYHCGSPAPLKVIGPRGEFTSRVAFTSPDPRTRLTLERERIVELGAIVMAGLLLAEFEGKRIERIIPRRGKADYFVRSNLENGFWLLEVSGTDRGEISSRKRSKIEQLSQSPYITDPTFRGGYVAITRFANPAVSLIEPWSP